MSVTLQLHRAGPAVSLQDLGRAGHMAQGVAQGGAADRLALLEAAALLGSNAVLPAIEMAGSGGLFEITAPSRFALTGGVMRARLDGVALDWNESHLLQPGQQLEIGGIAEGCYGYLTFAARPAQPPWLGSHASQVHLGIGRQLQAGDQLALLPDPAPETPAQRLSVAPRFSGGTLRMMPGPQTGLFDPATLQRALATRFRRDAAANRQGVRLAHDGAAFSSTQAAGLASDFITQGDVQMTGEGVPYVLLADCQTMGGYPRLGTILPQDLPQLAQAPLGAEVQLELISVEEADRLWQTPAAILAQLRRNVAVKLRDPAQIRDLLSYQLISGVTCGDDLD